MPRGGARPTCERPGCGRPHKALGLCSRHYEKERCKPDPRRHRPREDRVLATRARNRAVALLVKAHPEEFAELLERTRRDVAAEDAELRRLAEAEGVELTGDRQVFRFRSGPAKPDEDLLDRVATPCPECQPYHDAGHTCPTCSAPAPTAGSRADVEARMRCSQCGLDGSARRRPCVGVRARDGATIEYAAHDYTLEARRA